MNDLLTLLSTLPRPRAMLVSVVLLGLYYLIFFDAGEELNNQIQSVRASVETLQGELRLTQKQVEEVRQLKLAEEKDSERLQLLLALIPEKLSKVELMRTVSNEAKAVGASLGSLKDREAKSEPGSIYEEIGVEVSLVGGYSQFLLFLSNLTRLSHIVTVSDVSISGSGSAVGEGPVPLKFSAMIVGYRYKGEASPAQGSR